MKKQIILIIGIMLLALVFALPRANAEGASEGDGWDWKLAPLYLWAVDISGTQGFGTGAVDVDMKFDDVFQDLETIFTIHLEGVRDQRRGFILDLSYIDIESTETVAPGASIKSGLTAPIYELDGFHRLGEGPHLFDLMLGLRYYRVENSAAFTGGPFNGLSFEKRFDWVDALIGARWLWSFSEKWQLIVRGDVAAGGSDLTLNGSALVQWQPWKVVGFLGGYRALDIDYKDGSGADRIVYDMQQAGPILAVTFVW